VHSRALSVAGAWEFTPQPFADDRGVFLEWFKHDLLTQSVGHPMTIAQANHSVSARGVLRGIHFTAVPPGQAKFVYCPRGAVLDVVVDIRVGSPTFGTWDAVRLDEVSRRSVYLSEGLGHAFLALQHDSAVVYLCSTGYDPTREFGTYPLDPALNLPWPGEFTPIMSGKDAAAPSLAEAADAGMLPSYEECVSFQEALRR
jgi:dTDP-4-dehydrorhamnose 3,5-epimerase